MTHILIIHRAVYRSLTIALVLLLTACSQDDPLAPPGLAVTGVEVLPGESIQAAVDANPSGTTFILKAGTHRQQSVWPKNGNTFIGEPGTVLDGENSTQYAFRSEADDVTIRNVVVTRYAPPNLGSSAIEAIWNEAYRWVVEDCEVSYNRNGGVGIGHQGIVRRCHIHHNTQIGIVGWTNNGLIEDNEVSYNNTQGHDPNHEAGGMKLFKSEGLVIRNNHVHHNYAHGIWLDFNNNNCVIEGNLVEDNSNHGIFYEISYNGTIRNNIVRGNVWGIYVSSSSDVEVHNNTVTNNEHGILGLHDDRGNGDHGPFVLKDLWAHDNTIDLPSGGLNGILDWSGGNSAYASTSNDRFDRNHYNAQSSNPFWWKGDFVSWGAWQADGQDPNGTFN